MAAIVSFERVSKRFGPVVAVDDVSLDVAPGEFFALLGPSGCGKTTLMRMAAGFEAPDAGRVLIGGADMAGAPPHRRPVNMMFQSYALFPHMSVADNIAFGLRHAGISRSEAETRTAEMVQLVQLQGLEKRKPDQLSGGQKQRAALARALARRPQLLLLDEPLGALDRKLREETQFELMDIQKRLGTAFVVVTHDQDEAMAMADRIAVMRAGRIEQIGPPAEVYERPRSRFVAEFIGEINFFVGRVFACIDGLAKVVTDAGEVVVACDRPLEAGQAIVVAVRPERLSFVGEEGALPPSPSRGGGRGISREVPLNLLAGVVHDVVYRGDRRVFRVRLASGELVRVAVAAHVAAPAPGVVATLAFAPQDCVLLDA